MSRPPVTEAHMRAAFERLKFTGYTYAQAMVDPIKSRVIEVMASAIRTAEWQRTCRRTVEPVVRVVLGVDGHPIGYRTQWVPGPIDPMPDLFSNPN